MRQYLSVARRNSMLKRRWAWELLPPPKCVAVASGIPCTLLNAGEMVALATMAMVEAGTWPRLTDGWTVFGAGVLSVAAGSLVNAPDRATAFGYPLLLLVGLLMGHNRRAYRVQAEQSAALVVRLRQLRAEQRRVAVLDERARIAREIHDVLAHSLGALGIQIQAARALLAAATDEPPSTPPLRPEHSTPATPAVAQPPTAPPSAAHTPSGQATAAQTTTGQTPAASSASKRPAGQAAPASDSVWSGVRRSTVEQADGVLAVAQRIASDGLAETRRAVHALRSDSPPLDEELARMAAVHEQRHGSAVTAGVSGRRGDLAAEPTLALVRTAQESLVNAAKHAPRQPVALHLAYGDDDVTLTVSNPLGPGAGDGFATLDGGYGLTGMRERLLLLGGTLTAGPDTPAPDTDSAAVEATAATAARWTVTARVPR